MKSVNIGAKIKSWEFQYSALVARAFLSGGEEPGRDAGKVRVCSSFFFVANPLPETSHDAYIYLRDDDELRNEFY